MDEAEKQLIYDLRVAVSFLCTMMRSRLTVCVACFQQSEAVSKGKKEVEKVSLRDRVISVTK